MLGPFATASRRTPPVLILHCHSPGVATVARHGNVKSMSTTTTPTTTTTRDREDRYGPIEWAQLYNFSVFCMYNGLYVFGFIALCCMGCF